MYTIGIPKRYYRRATQVLGPESADPIEYEAIKQEDGFYQFVFPGADEYDFRAYMKLLNASGVLTVGDDKALTERKIMKLADLITEQPSPDENSLIDLLEQALERWKDDKVPPYDRLDSCERSDQYHEDIKDIVENYKNPLPSPDDVEDDEDESQDQIAMDVDSAKDFSPMQEQKLRNLIRKTIRE